MREMLDGRAIILEKLTDSQCKADSPKVSILRISGRRRVVEIESGCTIMPPGASKRSKVAAGIRWLRQIGSTVALISWGSAIIESRTRDSR